MDPRAKEGTVLATLVKMALPTLQEAERRCPRTGRGDRPKIPDWLIAALIMIVVLRKKKTKSAQYRHLREHRREIAVWLGHSRFPSRTTYFRRYRRAHHLYRMAVKLQGQQAVREGVTDPRDVAVDKSLIASHGPPWHQQDRKAGRIPAGVDRDSTWGRSEYDGWVHGYSVEVVVSSTPDTTVFPLLASFDTASVRETHTLLAKIEDLPEGTRTVSADTGYDSNAVGERIEYDPQGRRTSRRFLCPENPRNNRRPKTKPCNADASRAQSRARRGERRRFLESPKGRRLYARRGQTVEPFNAWLKSLFELHQVVWHRGVDNNRTQMLAAIFAYQLLVRYNHRCGNKNGQVCWILDVL
jgi:hypothetical protein